MMSTQQAPARDPLAMWVVYDRTTDYPGSVVARKHLVPGGATNEIVIGQTLEFVHEHMSAKGLHYLPRFGGDDPCIVGVWL